jgi:hypothetical protein
MNDNTTSKHELPTCCYGIFLYEWLYASWAGFGSNMMTWIENDTWNAFKWVSHNLVPSSSSSFFVLLWLRIFRIVDELANSK